MDKNKVIIFLSLLFWVQVTIAAVLGIKFLFFNNIDVIEEKALTPAMMRGEGL